nr:immunoglobulin heavy chain junction region [Mus musculus]
CARPYYYGSSHFDVW